MNSGGWVKTHPPLAFAGAQRAKKTSEMKSMDGDHFSYTGDGKNDMDKSNGLPQYSRDNQILTVEHYFSGAITLHEAIKQHLSERWRKERLDTLEIRLYNGAGNTTAVASTKEGSIV